MAERPINPPPDKVVSELRTPNLRDGFITLLVGREGAFYQNNYPIARGTPYAKLKGANSRIITEFASNPLYLLKEVRPGASSSADFGSSDEWVLWIFATQQIAQSNYNAGEDFPDENVNVSRWARSYETKRQVWENNQTVAYGSTLTALMAVAITAAGTGYTFATGTVGTGATCEAVVYNGAIIDWIVTKDGSGVTAGASITITGDGTGATATAIVQPVTAVLTHQEKKEYGSDNPRSHDYVEVIRVYEVLPGTELIRKGFDVETGTKVRVVKQRVAKGTNPVALGTSRMFDADTYYVQDSYYEPDTDVAGTLATTFWILPTAVLTTYDQDDKTQVWITTTYEVIAMPIPDPTGGMNTPGVVVEYKKIDSQKALKITRDFREFVDFSYEEQRFAGDTFPALWNYHNFFWTNGCGAFDDLRSQFSAHAQTRTVITFDTSAQVIAGLVIKPRTIKLGHAVNQINVIVDAGSVVYNEPDCMATTSWLASDPDYTTYVDTIQDTEQLISGESVLWMAGLWQTTEVYEIMY